MVGNGGIPLTDIAGFTKYGANGIHLFIRESMDPLDLSKEDFISFLERFCLGKMGKE